MSKEASSSTVQVLTDHKGWPVAVNEGAMWWMVAEVEPADYAEENEVPVRDSKGEFFELQLTNGRVVIARRERQQWTIASRKLNGRKNGERV